MRSDGNSHGGHRQRVKERFMQSGFDGFLPYEVLEMLLFYVIPQADTKPLAKELIRTFGSLSAVFDAEPEELMRISGISENRAVFLKMIPQLVNVYTIDRSRCIRLDSSDKARKYFIDQFTAITKEQFRVVCLNSSFEIIDQSIIAEGTHSAVSFDMKKMCEFIFRCRCCDSVFIAHNHPYGDIHPSQEDVSSTRRLYQSLSNVGIRLLDHVIVSGAGNAVSMRESGFFSMFE